MLKRVLAIFFLTCASVWGQQQPPATYQPQLISFNATPFGTCTVDLVALNVSNGAFYSCNPFTHTWVGALSNSLPLSLNGGGFTHTLTGTLTAPRTWTLQDASDTFVFRSTTDTLANKSFSTQIISTVSTGTAPFSISSTTQVTNLNAQLHGGLSAPASAIVGISDTQTLTGKTYDTAGSGNVFKINGTQIAATTGSGNVVLATSPALTTPTLDGTGAAHVASQVSAVTNFGTALGSQTIIASMPSTGTVSLQLMVVQVTAGVGCSAATNSTTVNPLTWTAPGGTVESINPNSNMGFNGNGVVDSGSSTFGSSAFTNNGIQAIVAKAGTSISYTTTSTLASTGCSTRAAVRDLR